ncbi:MAG: DUF805 domain-containing protein [Denitrovibrio sp.]|nr:MAG: DUF805 domain-containing protein [Denitrovibrio sp.]
MNWYIKVMKDYTNFDGRATRTEYWYFTMFNILFYIGASLVDVIIMVPIASMLYGLIVLLPGIAVLVRRLHDIGKTGWWILLSFVPVIGFVILIYFLVQDSHPDNEYGPNPKGR